MLVKEEKISKLRIKIVLFNNQCFQRYRGEFERIWKRVFVGNIYGYFLGEESVIKFLNQIKKLKYDV